ncbi:MAG TPA: hypothetical protein VGR48_08545 [Terriglobales bacterium]|nr:hypothetical protein [Terriglobales bacterium]
MKDPAAAEPKGWKKFVRGLLSLSQYLTGQEPSIEDSNAAVFQAVFPEIGASGDEKRVLSRHRVCIPAVLGYGVAGVTENTEVTNLNERGLFVFCSTNLAHGSMIQVELVLPAELSIYGRRRVRYHASVVRVEPQPSGQRFGIAAAIKNCDALPMENNNAFAAKV